MPGRDAKLLGEGLHHRRRRGGTADENPWPRGQGQTVGPQALEQPHPDGGDAGAEIDLLPLEQLKQAVAVEPRPGKTSSEPASGPA